MTKVTDKRHSLLLLKESSLEHLYRVTIVPSFRHGESLGPSPALPRAYAARTSPSVSAGAGIASRLSSASVQNAPRSVRL